MGASRTFKFYETLKKIEAAVRPPIYTEPMETWPETREKLSVTAALAQALFLKLAKKNYLQETARQLAQGKRQTYFPFFIYQHAEVYDAKAMAEDEETGEFVRISVVADKAKETVRDLGFRTRVEHLTETRYASMTLWDALAEFPAIALLESMCGHGYRIHFARPNTVRRGGYKTYNVALVLEYNATWINDRLTIADRVWPDAKTTAIQADGSIHWPASMGAPNLLSSPEDEWRKRVDALWPRRTTLWV